MGIFTIASQHIRFAVKLASAIVLALFVGFHFQLETPLGGVNGGDCRGWPGIRGRWGALPGRSAIAGCCVSSGRLSAVSPRSLLSF